MPVCPKKDIYILGATKLSRKLLESLGMLYINDHQYAFRYISLVLS
jgi:hypothetical protein